MEQHRTRPPHDGTRRGTPPLPPQAAQGGAAEAGARPAQQRPAARPASRQPGPLPDEAVRRLPNPRLTGLGGGLFSGTAMLVLGCLDALLFGSSTAFYGVLFLPVCLLTAIWVRRNDLVSAPVVVPIAFAVGLLPIADDGGGGLLGRLMGLVTALATQALWLYGGTLVAGVVVTVRKIALRRRQALRYRNDPFR
ncbi:DUF6542 domain-containing protein [Streptomyces sp. NPDC006476]|uniref:DUF6542 domain-containing protein n=1 Tax=Streptomyces sp. NPDC006476 TaxID=3157175 RepID=UPI0033B68B77